jgi:hypothetical protein
MAMILDGTNGLTTPGVVNTAGETIATNLTFTGTGNRITGDMSNATIANRVAFQTSTANETTGFAVLPNGTGTISQLLLYNNSDSANSSLLNVMITAGEVRFGSGIAGTGTYLPTTFYTSGSERVRIDSSGNVQIGGITGLAKLNDFYLGSSQAGLNFYDTAAGATAYVAINFVRNGSVVGNINTTNTATAYVTSSDYRLKENIVPMIGALDTVALLKPVTYKWKIDGSDGQGFIAHELQAVVPDCVTGEKDAVDAEGNPVHQGIDTSFLVATLTAAIQELKAIVDAQAVRIAALEA